MLYIKPTRVAYHLNLFWSSDLTFIAADASLIALTQIGIHLSSRLGLQWLQRLLSYYLNPRASRLPASKSHNPVSSNSVETTPRSSLALLYISVVLLSMNGLFAKSIALDAMSITQLRSLIAALGLAAILSLRRTTLGLPDWKTTFLVYGLGIVMGLHWITFFHSMQVSSVAVGIISLFCYPVITVIIEPLFYRGSPKLVDFVAAMVVLVGVSVMVSGETLGGNVREGVFWGICSAFMFSLRNTSQKYLIPHVPSGAIMLHQTIAIAVVLAVFTDWPSVVYASTHDWFLLVLLGLFGTAGAHTLFSMTLKRLSAKSVALIGCLQPFFGSIFAWLILTEVPTVQVIIGGLIVVSVAAYESLRKNLIDN